MKQDRISSELEIQTIAAVEALRRAFKEMEQERLDECGTVSQCDTIGMDEVERDDLDAFVLAGNDIEHVEEYRKAVRSYHEEERETGWVS